MFLNIRNSGTDSLFYEDGSPFQTKHEFVPKQIERAGGVVNGGPRPSSYCVSLRVKWEYINPVTSIHGCF